LLNTQEFISIFEFVMHSSFSTGVIFFNSLTCFFIVLGHSCLTLYYTPLYNSKTIESDQNFFIIKINC